MNGSNPVIFSSVQRVNGIGIDGNHTSVHIHQTIDFPRPTVPPSLSDDIVVDSFGNNVCSLCCCVISGENGTLDSHLHSEKHLTNGARFKTYAERERSRNQFVYSLLVDEMFRSKGRLDESKPSCAGIKDSNSQSEEIVTVESVKVDRPCTKTVSKNISQGVPSADDSAQSLGSLTVSPILSDIANDKLVSFAKENRFCYICGTEIVGTLAAFITHCRGKQHVNRRKRLVTPLMMRLDRHHKRLSSTRQTSSFARHTPFQKPRRSSPSKCAVFYKDAESSFALALANLSINSDCASLDEGKMQADVDDVNSSRDKLHLPIVPFQPVSANLLSNLERSRRVRRDVMSLEEQLRTSLCLDSKFRPGFQGVPTQPPYGGDDRKNRVFSPGITDDVDMTNCRGDWKGMNVVIKDVANEGQQNFKEEIFEIE